MRQSKHLLKAQKKHRPKLKFVLGVCFTMVIVFLTHVHFQLSQNGYSFSLVYKFITSWHTEKFLLGTFVLLLIDLLLITFSGSFLYGNLVYLIVMTVAPIVNFYKMKYRMEPLYPEDVKMIFEFGMFKDIVGLPLMIVIIVISLSLVGLLGYSFYRTRKQNRIMLVVRASFAALSLISLLYVGQFNRPNNQFKKAYSRTSLWIPYSQKMNYYNVGFVGGFLYNLAVDPMERPEGYTNKKVDTIVDKYNSLAMEKNKKKNLDEKPHIIYVMSESFSDPNRLKGVKVSPDPLKAYREVAKRSQVSGQMLSQGYGGGTANIEFEALTGFSMAELNPQLNTPYTMLLPKKEKFPSIVSNLNKQGYKTTAIHPYNTSMYKRNQVYDVLGFNQFISEKEMKHQKKIENNDYISDESAFEEILMLLNKTKEPQFIHLVTMQTHMPYNQKYQDPDFESNLGDYTDSLNNYAQDLSYTSKSLARFIKKLEKMERPVSLVFWGDHLPSFYPEQVEKSNNEETLHQSEYFIMNTKELALTEHQLMSPFYFQAQLTHQNGVKATGFTELLLDLQSVLPAFEKGLYYQNHEWHQTVSLNKKEQEIYEAYQMIQYDQVAGKGRSYPMFE